MHGRLESDGVFSTELLAEKSTGLTGLARSHSPTESATGEQFGELIVDHRVWHALLFWRIVGVKMLKLDFLDHLFNFKNKAL
jgi:hypothetical protein